jgi:outer membrane protein assembly factor BamB
VKKRIALAGLAVLLAAGGALGAMWYREQTETKIVRGSSTVEFETTSEPAEQTRPKSVVKKIAWPMYGFDAARTHVAADFKHRPPFRTLWNVQTGAYIEFPPAVAEGRVFLANQKGLFLALDGRTGKTLWKKDFGGCIASGPAVWRRLVVQTLMFRGPCTYSREGREKRPGAVVAMDQRTGRLRWRFDTNTIESSPLVVGNTVFFGSWNHHIYSLDLRSGRVRWSTDVGEEINSSAAFSDGTIFIGGDEGHLFALNAWTGKLKWRGSSFSRFGRREYFYATPTVAYGRVYIGNTDGTLYAFGAKSGDLLWAQAAGTYVYTGAAVWNRRVYIGTYDGRFRAFDAATGDPVWSWEAPGAIAGAPTIMGGLVYFSSASGQTGPRAQRYIKRGKRGTYALDARTGKLVWKWPGMGMYSPIVADEERVYLVGSTRVVGLKPKKQRKSQGGTNPPAETQSDPPARESLPARTRPPR